MAWFEKQKGGLYVCVCIYIYIFSKHFKLQSKLGFTIFEKTSLGFAMDKLQTIPLNFDIFRFYILKF